MSSSCASAATASAATASVAAMQFVLGSWDCPQGLEVIVVVVSVAAAVTVADVVAINDSSEHEFEVTATS